MDNYQAIFSDFDGTITGPGFEISSVVKEAVRAWIQSGRIFTIVTSKPFAGPIEEGCRVLELKDPIVTLAGTEILDSKTGRVICSEELSENETKKIISELDKTDFEYEVNDHNFV